jgi:hypothetical protein
LLRRFEREIREHNPQAPFRGSLVDDNMFAIDVNEWDMANLMEEQRKVRLSQMDERRAGDEEKAIRKEA